MSRKIVFLLLNFAIFSCSDLPGNSSDVAEEIQHAICKIATEDIQASANATITRQLKGVCTTKELNDRLDRLEEMLLSEIETIKEALGISKIKYKHLEMKENASMRVASTTEKVESTTIDFLDLQVSYKRDFEATKYNKTTQETEMGKTFLFYWKIYDIKEMFDREDDSHISSPVFFLLGHPLQINLYPSHLTTTYVALQLKFFNSYAFKHKFVILSQKNEQDDLSSQILRGNAALYRISKPKIAKGEFTIDGSLLIKVAIAYRSGL